MKMLLVLCLLLCAACAAPAEDKKQPAEPQVDTKMMMTREEEEPVPEDPVPVQDDTVQEEAKDPEARFNFCPPGWSPHGSRCILFSASAMTWYGAEEHCNSVGAHLASAASPQEYALLQQITSAAGRTTAWIGGFNLQGQWMWIDRQGYYYSNFYYLSTPVSSYPCLYLNSNAGWGNQQCGNSRPFICVKNMFGC